MKQTPLSKLANKQEIKRSFLALKKTAARDDMMEGYSYLQFSRSLVNNIRSIHNDLISRSYEFNVGVEKKIKKRHGGTRSIVTFSIRDKVVQKSLQRFLQGKDPYKAKVNTNTFFPKIYNRVSIAFIRKSKGNINNYPRDIPTSIKYIKQQYEEHGYSYITCIDIQDFFGQINNKRLFSILSKGLGEKNNIDWLIQKSLNQQVLSKDVSAHSLYAHTISGICQGSILSPLFSNIYLQDFDEVVSLLNIPVIRYADDIVILSKSKSSARKNLFKVVKILEETSGLQIHSTGDKKPIVCNLNNGAQYLGLYIRVDGKKQWTIKPCSHKVNTMKEKISSTITHFQNSKSILYIISECNSIFEGWYKYYDNCGCDTDSMKPLFQDLAQHYSNVVNMLLVNKGLTEKALNIDQLRTLGLKFH